MKREEPEGALGREGAVPTSFSRWAAAVLSGPVALVLAGGLVLRQSTGLALVDVSLDVVIVALAVLVLGLAGAGVRSRARRLGFYVVSGFVLHALVLLAETGSWVARRNWGLNLSGNVVMDFLPHLADAVSQMSWGAVSLIAVWIAASLSFATFWAAALTGRSLRMSRNGRRLALVACATLLFVIVFDARDEAGDPILSLLGQDDSPSLSPTPQRMAAWVRDEDLRRTFDAGVPNGKNLVLILSDGIRPDRLPFYGYQRDTMPFLRSLATTAGWRQVPRAYSAATESIGGIGSIVSGRGMRTMSGRSYGIVEFLARHGYRTHLLLGGMHNWYELRSMYGSRLTTYRDSRHAPANLLHDDRQIVSWVGELPDAGPDPSFVMLFLMGTHQLGLLPPEDELWSRGAPRFLALSPLPPKPSEWAQVSDRYDDQLRSADRRLAEIWKLLESKGYLRNSVVLFSSDHGQMLGEHGVYGHGDHLWEEGVRVPMVLWSDGSLPPVDTNRTAWTPDIAPTLAEAAGLRPLPSWEGLSLFDTSPRTVFSTESVRQTRSVRAVFFETGERRWKLHQESDADGVLVSEKLFDVIADPRESRDLVAEAPPELVGRLRSLLAPGDSLPRVLDDVVAAQSLRR